MRCLLYRPRYRRHSLAMMLLQSGVDLLTIQAWLGHAQVATTHRYAAADVEMVRRGLDKAAIRAPLRCRGRRAARRTGCFTVTWSST
ncbi:tyrosine-type recombinase/integrase [Cupriavidus lacunae]|uniref:tyrosine-type recombinase/integrase n=1 Tax=Cupriavidus lacunae TaxID=2666307 RepID=UPI00244A47F5|nr:tyrosine-type recombinase/integrase [Cupriavidus lacunae]